MKILQTLPWREQCSISTWGSGNVQMKSDALFQSKFPCLRAFKKSMRHARFIFLQLLIHKPVDGTYHVSGM